MAVVVAQITHHYASVACADASGPIFRARRIRNEIRGPPMQMPQAWQAAGLTPATPSSTFLIMAPKGQTLTQVRQ